ncbi:MAG: hypothetical protein ACREA2_02080, partial [Blastocatellia bacterium]
FFAGFAEGCIALLGFTGVALHRGGQFLIQFSPNQFPGNYSFLRLLALFASRLALCAETPGKLRSTHR